MSFPSVWTPWTRMRLGWAPEQTLQECSSAAASKEAVPKLEGLSRYHHAASPAEGKVKHPPSPPSTLLPCKGSAFLPALWKGVPSS